MEVIRRIGGMRSYAAERPVGFVPTMGYLHEGHLSLVRRARQECATVVLSIFVNPIQFGPSEDFGSYPRGEERDLDLARKAGVDVAFIPEVEEMYPEGFATEVRVKGLEDVLEGASRPGHFAGVATVLAKFLNVVGADRMYVGQKDAQQAVLVGRMLEDLNFSADLLICPIVREESGLAVSSRNVYMSQREKEAATALSRALFAARDSGERSPLALEEMVVEELERELLVEPEYVSANDGRTLGEVGVDTDQILLSLAARVGKTRLIDNVLIQSGP
jgi:pantoate--beta-alanine ligase